MEHAPQPVSQPLPRPRAGWSGVLDALAPRRWTIVVYVLSRLLLIPSRSARPRSRTTALAAEVGRWDGTWYAQIASTGYPMHVAHSPRRSASFRSTRW